MIHRFLSCQFYQVLFFKLFTFSKIIIKMLFKDPWSKFWFIYLTQFLMSLSLVRETGKLNERSLHINGQHISHVKMETFGKYLMIWPWFPLDVVWRASQAAQYFSENLSFLVSGEVDVILVLILSTSFEDDHLVKPLWFMHLEIQKVRIIVLKKAWIYHIVQLQSKH